MAAIWTRRALAARAIPHGIVTEGRMPLGDGMTFVPALHGNPAAEAVPILLVTARNPHLLKKPFDAATLVSRLAALGA